jgi:glycosyltransferase involved in cell wall biosynthesis
MIEYAHKYHPLVSVIVPNYNHAPFLRERIESILQQSYQNIEIILMDDVSKDNSKEILNEYRDHPKVKSVLFNEKNSGSTFSQWRKGLQFATGDLVWVAESDDTSDLSFLETMIQPFSKKNISLAYCQSIDIDEKGSHLLNRLAYTQHFQPNIWESDFVLNNKEFLQKYLFEKNVIPNASACLFEMKHFRAVLNEENHYSKYKKCGDWLVYALLCEEFSKSVAFVSKEMNFFRHSSFNTRVQYDDAQKVIRWSEEWVIRKQFGNRLSWDGKEAQEKMRLLEVYLMEMAKKGHEELIISQLKKLYPSNSKAWSKVKWTWRLKRVVGRG